jgi:hypothetical protein
MNLDRIAGTWRQLKGIARRQWGRLTAEYASVVARQANEKRLAEWIARQHKIDPIHK